MTSNQLLVAWAIPFIVVVLGVLVACTDRFPLGRLNRRWFFATFWGGAVIAILGARGLNAIVASALDPVLAWALAVPLLIVTLLGAAVVLASPLLRIHDLGLSGLYYFVLAIPFVQFLFMGALFLWPGAKDPNRFGARNRYLQTLAADRGALAHPS